MRRLFLIACLLLGVALPVAGQGGFTTVSGTIVGAVDGLTWSCGTITAQLITAGGVSPTLNGGGFSTSISPVTLGCPTSPGTGAPGSFTMRLADSGQISPSTTTWQFTVNMTPGIAPPAGTGPQSFTYTTAINCSTNTPSTCTANAMSISVQLSALAPKLSNASGGTGTGFPVTTNVTVNSGGSITVNTGGSIAAAGTGTIAATSAAAFTSVSSLPAIPCANGTSVYLNTGATGNYTCENGIWIGPSLGSGFNGAINPASFGVKADVRMCRDTNAEFTTTTTVTCLTGGFLPTDCTGGSGCTGTASKNIFGTCCGLLGGGNHQTSTLILPQGTIASYISSTQVTVSVAGTATTCASGLAGCEILWGTDDSTAWDSAWTAATGTSGICRAITMPVGWSFISTAKFLSTNCNTGITGIGSQGASILGTGYKTSMFVPLPNFVTSGCTGATLTLGNVDCFGPSIGFQLINAGIYGGDYGNNANFNGKVFINVGVDSYLINVLLAGLSSCIPATCTMIGVNFDASGQTTDTMIVDGFGAGNATTTGMCNVAGGSYNGFSLSFCGNTGGIGLDIAANARLVSYNGGWGGSKTSSTAADVVNNGFFTDNDGVFFGCTSACANLAVTSGSTTKLNNSNLIGGNGTGSFSLFFNNAATAKVFARNSFFNGGAANQDVAFATAMGSFNDLGGNSYGHSNTAILPACTESAGNGTCAAVLGSTNEKGVIRITAGTTTLLNPSFTMTFAGAFTGASAQPPSCTFLVANTGTGSWVTAAPVGGGLPAVTTNTTALQTVGITVAVNTVSASTYDVTYECTAK